MTPHTVCHRASPLSWPETAAAINFSLNLSRRPCYSEREGGGMTYKQPHTQTHLSGCAMKRARGYAHRFRLPAKFQYSLRLCWPARCERRKKRPVTDLQFFCRCQPSKCRLGAQLNPRYDLKLSLGAVSLFSVSVSVCVSSLSFPLFRLCHLFPLVTSPLVMRRPSLSQL